MFSKGNKFCLFSVINVVRQYFVLNYPRLKLLLSCPAYNFSGKSEFSMGQNIETRVILFQQHNGFTFSQLYPSCSALAVTFSSIGTLKIT